MKTTVSASKTIYEMLVGAAAQRPDATAIVYENETVTYAQLLKLVGNTANQLKSRGIRQGSTFAVYSQNRPELMYCYYAAAKMGARFVPINPNMTATEVQYTVEHSEAEILFYDSYVAEVAKDAIDPKRLFDIGVLAEVSEAADEPAVQISESDDFLIIYTSGSTGTPKAIVLPHKAQVGVSESLSEMWEISPNDTTLVALPLGYLYGLSTAAGIGLQTGGKVVILRRFRPSDVLESMAKHNITVFHGVPTMFSMMLEYTEQNDLTFDLSPVRQLISAGAPLAEELKSRFGERFGKPLQNYYSMTECTPVFGKYASDPQPVPLGSAGKLAPGVHVRVVGGNGEELGVGQEGEMFVRGPGLMSRYMNDESATSSTLIDGWFRSGDLGHRDDSGFYYITGRIKDIIIRGGANIAPSEVESVLIQHPSVQDAGVVGAPDKIFGEVPVAFIVKRAGLQVTQEELIESAEQQLADFKVPRQYVFVDSLPQGKTGKVDKKALREMWISLAG